MDAAKGSGDAIRKKEETHRMAEENRAFALLSYIPEQDLYRHIEPDRKRINRKRIGIGRDLHFRMKQKAHMDSTSALLFDATEGNESFEWASVTTDEESLSSRREEVPKGL